MTASIITVFNQKGGAGKTTISVHLAEGLARRGFRVNLVDTDEQGSASSWAAQAPEDKPFTPKITGMSRAGATTHRELQKHVNDNDFIVVDCPPALDSPIPKSTMLVADLAIIPMKASPVDIWAAQGAKELALDVKAINDSLLLRVLLNEVQKTKLKDAAMEMLSGDADIPPMNTTIGLRSAFRECAISGSTVYDIKSAKAAIEEVDSLVDEVLAILGHQVSAGKARKAAPAARRAEA